MTVAPGSPWSVLIVSRGTAFVFSVTSRRMSPVRSALPTTGVLPRAPRPRMPSCLLPPTYVSSASTLVPSKSPRPALQDTVADALEHEPGALLVDTQIRSELNRRNAFFEGGSERDRVQPLVQRHVAIATHGADFNSELHAALTTLEEFAVSTPVGF